MKTAKLMKSLRESAGLTQRELADAVGLKGNAGSQIISNIERGICLPPWDRVLLFAKFLKCYPNMIYGAMFKDDLIKVNKKYEDVV